MRYDLDNRASNEVLHIWVKV